MAGRAPKRGGKGGGRGPAGPGRAEGSSRGSGGRAPQGRSGPSRPAAGRSGGPAPARATEPRSSGLPVLYGRNAVREALRSRRRRVHRVWATQSTARSESWLSGVSVVVAEAEDIERRCGTDGHQGICAEAEHYPYSSLVEMLATDSPLLVALDEVQDVQNLGAIARTAECAGATGLLIPERRSAEVTPAAGKASAGAVEHLPIARVRNLADALDEAKAAGCWIYGAAGEEGAVPWTEPDYSGGVVLVLGAEGRGLRPRVRASCDALVALPLAGRIGSLNVGAAASALLFEIVRSRTT